MMKRSFALALGLLFLASTGMAADLQAHGSGAGAGKIRAHSKKHKGGKKNELNPQPLPPRVAPGTGNSSAPTGDKSQVNKNQ